VDIKRQSISISSTFSGTVIREKRKGRGAKAMEMPIHAEMLSYFEERVKNHPEAFIFTNPRTNGRPYSESAFKRVWDKVRTKGNLSKELRCYDATRHSLGSQLANSGESVFVISKILGHSSLKMTEKYMHKDLEPLRSTLAKMSLKKNTAAKLPEARKL
jgi:integrase